MTDSSLLLSVKNLTTEFSLDGVYYPAIHDICFNLYTGETFGLAGESGCGKSTAATAIMGMLPENGRAVNGHVQFKNRDLLGMKETDLRKIWWKEIAMIFQGSLNSLNPVRRVGSQLAEILVVRGGMSKTQAHKKVHELFNLIGIRPERSDDYPHEFSGGMRQRVMIAMAVCLDPPLIIADECTTALDVMIQAQIVALLKDLKQRFNLTMIFINHDLGLVAEICDRVAVMYAGRIVESGPVTEVFYKPAHPYVKQLVGALPKMEGPLDRLNAIAGSPPRLKEMPPGCPFLPRCSQGDPACARQIPPDVTISKEHVAACLKIGGIK
ncbi:MAG: ABC transporter ATP-binding protein [Desulfotignum sp.]|nr:ABC transporter ATP-binding protein [Desulfotignum sp.]